MDKYELRVSAEAVDSLIFQHKYKEATQLADTIDWRNVQSVRILCRVSDLYKYERRYEDSRDVLRFAYRRCPKNRQILYSMCELELKLGNYIRALQLYNAYINVAPTDSGRYVLKYKLYREQNVSLPEQIAVLEELMRHDFPEKWSYELARLYHRAGRDGDCADMCDEIAAFFGDGHYVQKALALKKSVTQQADTHAREKVPADTQQAAAQEELSDDTKQLSVQTAEIPDATQQTARWTQDSVREAAQNGGATGIWSSDAVRRAQEANRREYNAADTTDRKPLQPEQKDYEVKIDDSVLTDEQLTEPVAKGMRDLYAHEEPVETDTTETAATTTRSWDIREVREAEKEQESENYNTVSDDTAGVDTDDYSDEQLLEYAQEYAVKQGFYIDHSGLEALQERIEQMRVRGYLVVPEDIRDMIGEAVYYSGAGLHTGSTGAFSNTKHGNRGNMVLRDKDFIHY